MSATIKDVMGKLESIEAALHNERWDEVMTDISTLHDDLIKIHDEAKATNKGTTEITKTLPKQLAMTKTLGETIASRLDNIESNTKKTKRPRIVKNEA